jgi:hypothetical protein
MSAGVTPNPADEFVTFVQHQIPGLEDGTYELTIDQRIDDAHEVRINDDTLSVTYRFGVTGDRFSLANPAATISSVFPAPNATGEYTTSLANVVFSSPTFPWARAPTAPTTRVEVEVEKDVPTWMAVLVLDADDEAAFEGLTLEPKTRVVGDLFPRAAWEGTDLEDGYSYFEGAKNTDALEIDDGRRPGADDRHPAGAVRRYRPDALRPRADGPHPPLVGPQQGADARYRGAGRPDRNVLDRRRQPPAVQRHPQPCLPRLARGP